MNFTDTDVIRIILDADPLADIPLVNKFPNTSMFNAIGTIDGPLGNFTTESYQLTSLVTDGSNGAFDMLVNQLNDTIEQAVDWDYISRGRYSWDSLKYRDLCEELYGSWEGPDCRPFFVPDVFFFSCILFIFTFVIACKLKALKTSRYLNNRVCFKISYFVFCLLVSFCL
ncbi:unnamed protein product [Protopolystoma xenopodis]|uniref:Bicarbonate transporter-like transmembrane domain-containing protein n=1 Tax=Protopolystoma xenopodis TaxID=117903 RepID=A0A448X1V9_9PLAT|nr:unnamed protein product [Protopolystoma xenopodis]